jgi:hypothetical protein
MGREQEYDPGMGQAPPIGDAEPLQEDPAGRIADRAKLMELFPVIRSQPFQ